MSEIDWAERYPKTMQVLAMGIVFVVLTFIAGLVYLFLSAGYNLVNG